MVIVSIGICNRNGQPIISRQFDNMKRSSVEDLYLSFPKMLIPNQQHTYVQSSTHTFLYIPIESLYLVLVSTKNSNIIEDQQTLRMIYKVLIAVCPQGINLDSVEENSIDIIMGIDDVVSMGFRESVSIQEVNEQIKMESSQEKAHLALVKQQEQQAKEAAKKFGEKK